jgi:hypothetical protein
MITVRELALQKDLLKIPQRRRHRLHALAKLDKVLLDELLVEAGLEQLRQEVPHVPAVKTDLRNVVALK